MGAWYCEPIYNVMGILAPIVTGFIVAGTGSFALGFIVAAVVLAIGIICYVVLLGRIEQIQMPVERQGLSERAAAPATTGYNTGQAPEEWRLPCLFRERLAHRP